ncbi:hypothetical protein ASZ90_008970 [hydrocarbon metagenome]|uniref:Uncharacterized protein n=1 Tax=hydrocarbon metagenome TaxID=938273 RepID=A0A0W8FKK4_9ZZZZ
MARAARSSGVAAHRRLLREREGRAPLIKKALRRNLIRDEISISIFAVEPAADFSPTGALQI